MTPQAKFSLCTDQFLSKQSKRKRLVGVRLTLLTNLKIRLGGGWVKKIARPTKGV